MPAREDLPSTLERSPQHAQDIWSETHDSAVEQYGEGARAHRTAFAALKRQYEKVGDRWEKKERSGSSDDGGYGHEGGSRGGVNANSSKKHLLDIARRLDVPGRSSMSKAELVEAIERANERETRRALED